ncbi:MAG: hypothetical protein WBM50_03635 [Acidimicrobiales bacterium]
MAKHQVLASVSVVALLLLAACESRSCTLVAPVSGVVVDTADYPIDRTDEVEVCLDDRCVPLYEIEVTSLGHGGSGTVIRVEGDARERTIVIRSHSGQVLAGPAVVDLALFQPNGEGCPGVALQGRFRVDADGVIG